MRSSPQAAEVRDPPVTDLETRKLLFDAAIAKLRIPAGLWNGTNIDNFLDRPQPQQLYKFID